MASGWSGELLPPRLPFWAKGGPLRAVPPLTRASDLRWGRLDAQRVASEMTAVVGVVRLPNCTAGVFCALAQESTTSLGYQLNSETVTLGGDPGCSPALRVNGGILCYILPGVTTRFVILVLAFSLAFYSVHWNCCTFPIQLYRAWVSNQMVIIQVGLLCPIGPFICCALSYCLNYSSTLRYITA